MRNARFNSGFQEALTIDALRHYVPSAFATGAHESRSHRFAYIETAQVIEGLVAQGLTPFKAVQGKSKIEGKEAFTKHMIRFRYADQIQLNGNIPEVVLMNAHDGTSAYKLFSGIFRTICTNGMIVFEKNFGELSIPHKGDVVHKVIEGSFEILDHSRKALDTVDRWSNLHLTNGEQDLFAKYAHQLRFADAEGHIATPITPAQLMVPRRSEDRSSGTGAAWNRPAPDLYTTLNVVQENAIKGGLSARMPNTPQGRGQVRTSRAVNGIDQDVKLNRALWQLAAEMAKLKGEAIAA